MEIKELTAYEVENKQLANDILDRNYYSQCHNIYCHINLITSRF